MPNDRIFIKKLTFTNNNRNPIYIIKHTINDILSLSCDSSLEVPTVLHQKHTRYYYKENMFTLIKLVHEAYDPATPQVSNLYSKV